MGAQGLRWNNWALRGLPVSPAQTFWTFLSWAMGSQCPCPAVVRCHVVWSAGCSGLYHPVPTLVHKVPATTGVQMRFGQ